jgi:hypothetical protein
MKLTCLFLVLVFSAVAQTNVVLVPGTDQGTVSISLGGSTNFNPMAAQIGLAIPANMTLSRIEALPASKSLSTCMAKGTRVNCVVIGENVDRIAPGAVLNLTLTSDTLACRPLAKLTDATAASPDGVLVPITTAADVVRLAWPLLGDENKDGLVDDRDINAALQRALSVAPEQAASAMLALVRAVRGKIYPATDCPLP